MAKQYNKPELDNSHLIKNQINEINNFINNNEDNKNLDIDKILKE